MRDTFYPGADRVTQWRGQGGVDMPTVDKLLLHSTESMGWPAYPNFQPTLTFNPWLARGKRWRQHLPINGSASTLENAGDFRTNRVNVAQVEIVGYCDPAKSASSAFLKKMPADAYAELGELLAWLHKQWDVKLAAAKNWPAYPDSYGIHSPARMTVAQFGTFSGVCGHLHAPGNVHGDPGNTIDAEKVVSIARRLIEPPRPVYRLLSLNAQWPGFNSTPKSPTWASRCHDLAARATKTGASIIIAQELGKDEAADLVQALGSRWSYQRTWLNAILWRDDWKLEDPTAGNKSRDFLLPSFGQLQRTAIAARLVHQKTKQYVWAAGSHLAAAASDLSAADAEKARLSQAKEIGRLFAGFRQIIFGADLNDRSSSSGPRKILHDAGWKFDAEQVTIAGLTGDAKHGIDALATKSRVTLKSVAIVPLGNASDHDGRLATFTITDK